MPRGDGTGPNGMGPMTGHGEGFCVEDADQVVGRKGYGFGRRGGRGRGGRGCRNQFYTTGLTRWQRGASGFITSPDAGVPLAQPAKELQSKMLKGQAEFLEEQLAGIRTRLTELEAEKK